MKLPGPTILIAGGVAIVVAGFAYDLVFAGLPYQDPPPDLYASWRFHGRIANAIGSLGALVLASGIVVATARVVSRAVSRSRKR